MKNITLLSFFLIILYIILIINILNYKEVESFIDIIDFFQKISTTKYTPNPNGDKMEFPKLKKNIIKYILLRKESYNYSFYNKSNNKYMLFKINENIIEDSNDVKIGNLKNRIYNKMIFTLNIYENDANVEYLNNFTEVKIYLDDDDKIFKIIKEDNDYIIYLYKMKIGKIKEENKFYKIMVYEEYKIYLNLIGIGLIKLLHS